jgi:hypothetical protein
MNFPSAGSFEMCVATLEEAKAQFQKSWDAWKAWAKLERCRANRDRVTAFQPLGASPRFPPSNFSPDRSGIAIDVKPCQKLTKQSADDAEHAAIQ